NAGTLVVGLAGVRRLRLSGHHLPRLGEVSAGEDGRGPGHIGQLRSRPEEAHPMTAHQESVTGTGLRTPRAAAAAGIVFSLLLGLALVLLLVSAPSDTAAKGPWLTHSSHRAAIALALNLVPFAGIAFLWFIGVVRDRIGQREDRFFASVFLGSGLLFVAMLFVGAAVAGGLIGAVAAGSAVPGPDTLATSRQLTRLVLHVYALRMAAVFTI